MNKAIKAVATAMIVILIVVLIWIFLSYYGSNEIIDTMYQSGDSNVSTLNIPSGNYIDEQNGNLNYGEGIIESIIKNSSETQGTDLPNINQGTEVSGDKVTEQSVTEQTTNQEGSGEDIYSENNSGDNENITNNSGDNSSGDSIPNTIIEIPGETQEDPVQITMTSDLQTSNQQKQEILTEIDKALQGLLEAVGKVEVVDEERLNATLNSEVDKP